MLTSMPCVSNREQEFLKKISNNFALWDMETLQWFETYTQASLLLVLIHIVSFIVVRIDSYSNILFKIIDIFVYTIHYHNVYLICFIEKMA